jgi:hypothetical protein
MNGIHTILACVSDINLLSEDTSTSKRTTPLVTRTVNGLGANLLLFHNQTKEKITI